MERLGFKRAAVVAALGLAACSEGDPFPVTMEAPQLQNTAAATMRSPYPGKICRERGERIRKITGDLLKGGANSARARAQGEKAESACLKELGLPDDK